MRKTEGWPRLRTAVIALGLIAWTATGAMASPLSYTTSGQINTDGVDGTAVISFVPLSGNTVDFGSGQTNVSLGNFVLTSPGRRYVDHLHQHAFPDQLPARVVQRRYVSEQRILRWC